MLKQRNLTGFQNENWGHLQIFYIAVLCEAIQVCSDFSFGQEAALLGITVLEDLPVPDSKLALLESPEMVPSKPGEVNLGAQCSPQSRGHPAAHQGASIACQGRSLGAGGEAALGSSSGKSLPAPLRGAHALLSAFSL